MGRGLVGQRVMAAGTVRIAGAGLLAALAYMIGTQGVLEPSAWASSTSTVGGAVVFMNDATPPVIVLNEHQRAIIGASDGLYYLVDFNGNTYYVKGQGRGELEWHRGPVPPISR